MLGTLSLGVLIAFAVPDHVLEVPSLEKQPRLNPLGLRSVAIMVDLDHLVVHFCLMLAHTEDLKLCHAVVLSDVLGVLVTLLLGFVRTTHEPIVVFLRHFLLFLLFVHVLSVERVLVVTLPLALDSVAGVQGLVWLRAHLLHGSVVVVVLVLNHAVWRDRWKQGHRRILLVLVCTHGGGLQRHAIRRTRVINLRLM